MPIQMSFDTRLLIQLTNFKQGSNVTNNESRKQGERSSKHSRFLG